MTEQEKMKKGYLWEDDEENMALQAHAKSIISRFNSLPAESMGERAALLKDVFGSVGENVWIVPPLNGGSWKIRVNRGWYLCEHEPDFD